MSTEKIVKALVSTTYSIARREPSGRWSKLHSKLDRETALDRLEFEVKMFPQAEILVIKTTHAVIDSRELLPGKGTEHE